MVDGALENYCMVIAMCVEKSRLEDGDSFRNFLLMEQAMFDELLRRIRRRISKQNTWYRQAIDSGLRMTAVHCVLNI